MYYNEHQPPHFHAYYGEHQALVSIESLAVIAGSLPPRSLGLVIEWASLHRDDLERAWQSAVNHERLEKIAPLE